ncbi:unnamed protein product [Urochloa humidicola]
MIMIKKSSRCSGTPPAAIPLVPLARRRTHTPPDAARRSSPIATGAGRSSRAAPAAMRQAERPPPLPRLAQGLETGSTGATTAAHAGDRARRPSPRLAPRAQGCLREMAATGHVGARARKLGDESPESAPRVADGGPRARRWGEAALEVDGGVEEAIDDGTGKARPGGRVTAATAIFNLGGARASTAQRPRLLRGFLNLKCEKSSCGRRGTRLQPSAPSLRFEAMAARAAAARSSRAAGIDAEVGGGHWGRSAQGSGVSAPELAARCG